MLDACSETKLRIFGSMKPNILIVLPADLLAIHVDAPCAPLPPPQYADVNNGGHCLTLLRLLGVPNSA